MGLVWQETYLRIKLISCPTSGGSPEKSPDKRTAAKGGGQVQLSLAEFCLAVERLDFQQKNKTLAI